MALSGLCMVWDVSQTMAYTLYGYEDEYGIIHLQEKRISERYVLLYSGEKRPKLSLAAIKRLIQSRGGASPRAQGCLDQGTRQSLEAKALYQSQREKRPQQGTAAGYPRSGEKAQGASRPAVRRH